MSINFRCLQVLFVGFYWTLVSKIFNDWISQSPRVKENGAVEDVVVCFFWPEVEACFEIKPRFKEAFNAWIV